MPARSPRGVLASVRLALLAGVLLAAAFAGAKATTHTSAEAQGGFVSDIVQSGLPTPIDVAMARDGRIFIASKNGSVFVIDGGVVQPAPFITLPVNTFWDRGLESIELDPDFATNHYVYLYYTFENSPAAASGAKVNQLIRVTAVGNVAAPGSQVVLLGNETGDADHPACQDHPVDCIPGDSYSHMGGGLAFLSDGTLLLSTGDAAAFPPYYAETYTSRSQDLDSLAGKVLRINPSDGTAPADNPFYTGDPDASRSKVWAYGFRNPFRMTRDVATGQVLLGDVGSNFWEEVDDIQPGLNYGWPCYEGTAQHGFQQAYASCQALYASEAVTQHPLYSHQHGLGATLIGGVFTRSANYPPDMQGAFILGDWARKSVSFLPAGQSAAAQELISFPNAGSPVAFDIGPDGDVYYVEWNGAAATGTLRHLRFVEGNRAPRATASVWPPGGRAPLRTYFSAADSSDPEGGELSYLWDFGDGATSTQKEPQHTFAANGSSAVSLTVFDEDGAQSSTAVPVLAGNFPPVATILTPQPSSSYAGGELLSFTGGGGDPEEGPIPPARLAWNILLHHCVSGASSCHTHPYIDAVGAGGSLVIPIQDDDSYYLELRLTATDNAGLQNTDVVLVGADADGDGLPDAFEELASHTDPAVGDTDGDGCPDGKEIGLNEFRGGHRDPLNSWDYFNAAGDGQNGVFAILAVLRHFGLNQGDPGYDTKYDRSYMGPYPWSLGPPDGMIRVADILDQIYQYNHNCAPD